MRLFVSVDLPQSLADSFADVQEKFRGAEGLRFTDPEQAHTTLKFLGETEPRRVEDVEEAIDDAIDGSGIEPFNCAVEGLGVFPSLDYIRVVWIGVPDRTGGAPLRHLHQAIERETTALGFEPEDHDFTPHFTLARMNDARGKDLVRRVVENEDPTVGTFRVEQVRLKESTLTDEGPKYETVSRFSL